MKILFMGTPEFAVPSLNALLESKHEVVGVVSQPDRALKHGKTEAGAVKKLAEERGLKIIQPVKIRDDVQALKSFGADIAVTAAYGQLLTQSVIDVFPRGILNVHASLLPKYRGASPIQSAIANGEKETGVTIMRTELGLDTGDILRAAKTEIKDNETAGELTARLAEIGARLLVDTLDGYDGITPVKQDERIATHCKTIKKEQTYLDFSLDAEKVQNTVRALSPSPCAKTVIRGEIYKIYSVSVCADSVNGLSAGEIIVCDKNRLVIACGNGAVAVNVIQAPSKRALPINEFLRGRRFDIGEVCAKPQ